MTCGWLSSRLTKGRVGAGSEYSLPKRIGVGTHAVQAILGLTSPFWHPHRNQQGSVRTAAAWTSASRQRIWMHRMLRDGVVPATRRQRFCVARNTKRSTDSSPATRWRKRRGSVSSPRHDTRGTEPIDIAAVPPRRVSGRSKRASYHAPRRRKLSPEQEAAIRSEAGNRTLRELAAAFGVSHETIRTVLRQELPAMAEIAMSLGPCITPKGCLRRRRRRQADRVLLSVRLKQPP